MAWIASRMTVVHAFIASELPSRRNAPIMKPRRKRYIRVQRGRLNAQFHARLISSIVYHSLGTQAFPVLRVHMRVK